MDSQPGIRAVSQLRPIVPHSVIGKLTGTGTNDVTIVQSRVSPCLIKIG
jgi:hypothetical protein